jgi:hypothetical protein
LPFLTDTDEAAVRQLSENRLQEIEPFGARGTHRVQLFMEQVKGVYEHLVG